MRRSGTTGTGSCIPLESIFSLEVVNLEVTVSVSEGDGILILRLPTEH
jgi:hypothetical protein